MFKNGLKIVGIIVFITAFLSTTIILISQARSRRAAEICIENLHFIDGAKGQMASELHKNDDYVPTWEEIRPWLPWSMESGNEIPQCPLGGTYAIRRVGDAPTCSIPAHSMDLGPFNIRVTDEFDYKLSDATVEVIDQSGRRKIFRSGVDGSVTISTWPYKVKFVIVSKIGYFTSSNSVATLSKNNWDVQLRKKE